MAERKRDNETRDRRGQTVRSLQTTQSLRSGQGAREAKPERPKGGGLRRALILALVLLAVLGAVAAAAARDRHGMESLRRMLNFNKGDGSETAETYAYDADRSNRCAMVGGRLLVVSTTRIRLLDADGTTLYDRNVNFDAPAIAAGAGLAAVYDVGGRELYLLSGKGLVRDMSAQCAGGVVSAAIGGNGYLAVTTGKSGYKSAVSVYDEKGEKRFEFNSSDRYVMDARVLNDGKHLAAVTLGEADGAFASMLVLYALDSEKPVAEKTLTGSLVLSLEDVGGTLCAVEDDRVTFFSGDGALAGTYRYEYPYLRGSDVNGAGFAALLLSRYRSGSALKLVTVDAAGAVLGSLDLHREVLDVSAAGNYVAVLYGDRMTIYTSDLSVYAELADSNYAKSVLAREDGSALLLGAASAWRFVP